MENYTLSEHKHEYISNFNSESAYIAEGKQDVNFRATLLNLNYENGALYHFSIFIYDVRKYESYKLGELEEREAHKGGISEKIPLVKLLSNSNKFKIPSYIDLPINFTVKNLDYKNGEIYIAVLKIKNRDGKELSSATTFFKGVSNGL